MDKITPLGKSGCHHIWLIVVDYYYNPVQDLFITANLTKMDDRLRFVGLISPVWDGTKMVHWGEQSRGVSEFGLNVSRIEWAEGENEREMRQGNCRDGTERMVKSRWVSWKSQSNLISSALSQSMHMP